MDLSIPSPHRRSQYLWPAVAFIVIAAITAAHHISETSRIADAYDQLLAVNAEQVADDVEAALEDYTGGARAAGALVRNDPLISQTEYERAMAHVVRQDRSRAIAATNVIKRIERGDLSSVLETKAQLDGMPLTPFPERDAETVAPVWLLYPLDGNEAARGFDILANEAAVTTLESSLDSNQPRMTPGLTIVQETEDQVGFIIYVPMVGSAFEGWTNAVFRGQQFLGNVLGDLEAVSVTVSDGSTADAKIIGRISPDPDSVEAPTELTLSRTIFGQEWVFDFTATPALDAQASDEYLMAVTIGGLTLAVLGAMLVFLLIRQREHAERLVEERTVELVATNDRLVEAGRVKDDFLAVVSHELRTPLTVIMGMTDMVREDVPLGTEGSLCLDRIEHNSRRMGDLVEDLLLTAQIDAGKLETRPQAVALSSTIESLVADLSGSVEDIHLEVVTDGTLLVDPSHLERMISNLLTNAQKYGRPPIRITAGIEGSETVIRVIDSGAGVPAHQIQGLFERFEQGTTGKRRTSTGVGLGLSIVRELAEVNGGSARYLPEEASTTFEIRLPSEPNSETVDRPAHARA